MSLRAKICIIGAVLLSVTGAVGFYMPNPLWSTDGLIRCTKSDNDLHRLISVGLLKDRISGSDKVIPALVLALGDNWDEVRGSASAALCGAGAGVVPRLKQALEDENPYVRQMANTTLSCIRPAGGKRPAE